MSVSFKNFVVEASATQRGIRVSSPSGDVSDHAATVTANINLPEGLRAKVHINDKTASSILKNPSSMPSGISAEIIHDKASLLYNLETQRATVKINHNMNVSDREIRALVTYKQEGDNNVDIELSHAPTKESDVTAIYNIGSSDVTLKGRYELDEKTTIEPVVGRSGKSGAISWNVKAIHRMTSSDKIEARINSDKPSEPHLSYTRTQDGVDLIISAPLSSDIAADASVKINRTFAL